MKRDQHEDFGHEIRNWLHSTKNRPKLQGKVKDELDNIKMSREELRPNPKEETLSGRLSSISYVKLYYNNESIRMYFTVKNDVIYMLMFEPSKRRTRLTSSVKDSLEERLKWAEKQ